MTHPDPAALAKSAFDRLRTWACEKAFPIWCDRGLNRLQGGVQEKLGQDGLALPVPRRARVQPRQIYSFAMAPRLGWKGPWEPALHHALTYYRERFFRPDGRVRALVGLEGQSLDERADLYDQAFALFGLSVAHQLDLDPQAQGRAHLLMGRLGEWAHPLGGFREAAIAGDGLHSNPHMHLLEACLAWMDLDQTPVWRHTAQGIVALALSHMIDPVSGGMREFFDDDWQPKAGTEGRIIEPGHQFEWGWLLLRWAGLSGDQQVQAAALRLIDIGESRGVDGVRGVAFNQLLTDGSHHDEVARLWPQTERLKAAALRAEYTGDAAWWQTAARAAEGLELYLHTPIPGLWFDRMTVSGDLIDEPAPASSFYHIICAIVEFGASLQRAEARSQSA